MSSLPIYKKGMIVLADPEESLFQYDDRCSYCGNIRFLKDAYVYENSISCPVYKHTLTGSALDMTLL
jgi:nitrite reductase/ring-hydroxylating ferredoxin subunit